MLLSLVMSAALFGLAQGSTSEGHAPTSTRNLTPVHVLFLTDCTMYSNWQSVGDMFSFRMSGQPGTMSRVMCCTPKEAKSFDGRLEKVMETWVAPSMTIHPKTGDNYAAYNKPEAVIDWMEHNTPKEEYVLVLDSDMILRRPFLVEDMKPRPGWAIGAKYTYMIGVANELAERHVPQIAKRNDTFAGPYGRKGDQVGGFFFMHRDDLKRMSHGWLKYTEDVRGDTEAYRLSGDSYAIHPGDKPWISEMYGYAFGAATADVWHHWDPYSMLYPGYDPGGIPKLMHYGLLFEVQGYKFDKHWHYDFDVTVCPPWDLSNPKSVKAGIFPPPPRPSTLKSKGNLVQYYRDLLAIETVATLNAGFCDYHLLNCPPSQQILDVCTEALDLYVETVKALNELEPKYKCSDKHVKCPQWSKDGECAKNFEYMKENCALSCGECSIISDSVHRNMPTETLQSLEKLKATLAAGSTSTSSSGAVKGDPDVKTQGKTADPDSSKVASPVAQAKAAPVASPLPPSPPPPTASPPPPSPPPPSPPPPSPPQVPVVNAQTAVKTKARKDLLVRCYRMSLTAKEVKECTAAAGRGETWNRPGGATAQVQHTEQAETKVSDHDVDDLRLLRDKADTPNHAPAHTVVSSALAQGSTGQAVAVWGVILLVVLFLGPRIIRRLRRRARSGMRSE